MAGTTRVEDAAEELRRKGTVILDAGELMELRKAAQDNGGDPQPEDQALDPDWGDPWAEDAPEAEAAKPKTRATRTAPISAATKAKVRKLAREGMGRGAIAKACNISGTSVGRICAAARPPITFDRSATEAATAAAVADLKARRANLSHKAMDEVDRLFGLLTTPHEVVHWDKDGFMHRDLIERPTSGDVKNYVTSIGILVDKHIVLVRHDADDRDKPAVEKWLEAMMGLTGTGA